VLKVWANVQREELPRHTRFDVTHRSDWWPAFGRNVAAPVASVQPATLDYIATSLSATQMLQDRIEKQLKDSLMKWRKTSRSLIFKLLYLVFRYCGI
jgi:hypothetical protein